MPRRSFGDKGYRLPAKVRSAGGTAAVGEEQARLAGARFRRNRVQLARRPPLVVPASAMATPGERSHVHRC